MAGAPPVVRWLLVVTAAIWVMLELRQSTTHRPEGVKASWGGEVLFRVIVGIAALAAGVLSAAAPSAPIRPAAVAVWIGLALFWRGISLRLWSFWTLGRYFTFTVETSGDQPVIAEGPYRGIRHPSYAGLLLVMMAVDVFIGNWWSLVCLTGAVAGGLVFPIRVEEGALLQNLGAAYGFLRGHAQTAGALRLVIPSHSSLTPMVVGDRLQQG